MVRIALTGASGFVGGHVIEMATRKGWEIHSFGRTEVPGTISHPWDMNPESSIGRGEFANNYFDAVIHSAVVTHENSDLSESAIYSTNTFGTEKALRIDPTARFIYVSSASVYHDDQPKDRYGFLRSSPSSREDDVLGNTLNAYSRSKVRSESFVLNDSRAAGSVILRPHAIYGKGDTSLVPRIEESVKNGKLLLPNYGKSFISLTRASSLADVIGFFVEAEKPRHTIYNVADRSPVELAEALKEVLSLRGHGEVKITGIPRSVAWKMAALKEKSIEFTNNFTSKSQRQKKDSVLSRYLVSQLGFHHEVVVDRLEEEMGKTMPTTDLSDCASW